MASLSGVSDGFLNTGKATIHAAKSKLLDREENTVVCFKAVRRGLDEVSNADVPGIRLPFNCNL